MTSFEKDEAFENPADEFWQNYDEDREGAAVTTHIHPGDLIDLQHPVEPHGETWALESDHYRRVKDFMQQAGQECPDGFVVPSKETLELRAKLILEEALEMIEALGVDVRLHGYWIFDVDEMKIRSVRPPDIVEVIDGCCDIRVVTTGTLIAFGLPDEAFQYEIDQSNLRKFDAPKCGKCSECMVYGENIESWYCDNGHGREYRQKESGPYRRDDGKWIKPLDWKPPKIQEILDALIHSDEEERQACNEGHTDEV